MSSRTARGLCDSASICSCPAVGSSCRPSRPPHQRSPHAGRRTFPREIALFAVNADTPRVEPDARASCACSPLEAAEHACDRERGWGAYPSSRPPTCGWEAPFDRLGNRSSASQRTRLCVGRGVLIGVSLLTDPTSSRRAGHAACLNVSVRLSDLSPEPTCLPRRARPACKQSQTACVPAGRPCGTSPCSNRALRQNSRARLLTRELACQHEPLIAESSRASRRCAAGRRASSASCSTSARGRLGHIDPTARAADDRKRARPAPPGSGCARSARGGDHGCARAISARARWRCGRRLANPSPRPARVNSSSVAWL